MWSPVFGARCGNYTAIPMEINAANLNRLLTTYLGPDNQVLNKPAAKGAGSAQKTDRLDLSRQSLRRREMEAVLADLPEIRAELVAVLRESVQAGQYRVDPEAVAEKIIGHLLMDAGLTNAVELSEGG